jgi:NADH dehydrogenase/NADH:ubiquinone oxidoreductase subunit G
VVLASGRASTESLGMVKRLLEGTKLTAAVQLPQGDEAPLKGVPNLALRKERAPNGEGARILGYTTEWSAALKAASSAALVVLLDVELTEAEATQVGKANTVVVFGTVQSQELAGASVVLPVTNVAEEMGTFVNRDRRVQRYDQAKPSPGMAQPAWWVAASALAQISGKPAPAGVSAAFDLIAASVPTLNGLTFAGLGFTGRVAEKPVTAGAAS